MADDLLRRDHSKSSLSRRIAVVGAGSWGTTIASILARRAPTVLWARSEAVAQEIETKRTNSTYLEGVLLPAELEVTTSIEDALQSATLVVLAVPSHGVRAVLSSVSQIPPATVPVLSLAKGLEQESALRVSQVVEQCWPGRSLGVLAGPNLAHEVANGQPTASVVAMADENSARELQELFRTENLRIYTNPDLVGCEISGVVKNVMAIATGMAAGLGFGANTRAALITRSLAELTRLGASLGGEVASFAGLAGLGDLVVTCTSEQSRNYRFGMALGMGMSPNDALASTPMVVEGFQSSRPVVTLARRMGVEVPVVDQVVAVCHEGRAPQETVTFLMGRASRSEIES